MTGPRMRRVAVLIETSREYGRGILRGIIRYQREAMPWSLYFQPWGLRELPADWLARWDGDGILVRAHDRALAEVVVRSGIPAIDLRLAFPDLGLPSVGIDNQAVVELAVRHLRDQGLRHLAFCGMAPGENYWTDFRGKAFAELVQQAGGGSSLAYPVVGQPRPENWEAEQQALTAWVASLPRPVGIMACHDDRGLQVLDACRRAGARVPDEIAVIGIDDDEFLCHLATPSLSSVDLGVERVGHTAAGMLDQLMAGQEVHPRAVFLAPLGVSARQSTEALAIADVELARLIRTLRDQACEGIRVEDLLKPTTRSPSTLQRQFRAVLGRGPKAEIIRVQLERARQLLVHTDLDIGVIAVRCGFSELKRFTAAFHARVGMPPGQFRRQSKPGD